MHPGIAALVVLGEQNLDPVGAKLIGDRLDVVDEEAGDRTGREVAIHIAVWSEDLNFAAVGQLQHAESRTIQFGSKAHNVSEEVSGLLEVLGARPHPCQLDDLHTVLGTPQRLACQPGAESVTTACRKAEASATGEIVQYLKECRRGSDTSPAPNALDGDIPVRVIIASVPAPRPPGRGLLPLNKCRSTFADRFADERENMMNRIVVAAALSVGAVLAIPLPAAAECGFTVTARMAGH